MPASAQVTPRAKAMIAAAVLDKDRSVAAVAGQYRCGWHTVHDYVITVADETLGAGPAPVRVLGIDGIRRGKAKWEQDLVLGRRVWVDRCDTGLVDITGDQGLLGQVNGRNSAVVIDWIHARDPDWRAQITHVTIDLSAVYAKAARDALPHAKLIADRFHLVKKANDMLDAVRRRVTWTQRGRRGCKADVEWINRRRLLRGAERLTAAQRATLLAKLLSANPNEDIAAAWIAKEPLRELLSRTSRGGLRYEITAALDRFYRFCTACTVPEIIRLARTIAAHGLADTELAARLGELLGGVGAASIRMENDPLTRFVLPDRLPAPARCHRHHDRRTGQIGIRMQRGSRPEQPAARTGRSPWPDTVSARIQSGSR